MGDPGAKVIAQALSQNPTLHSLNLRLNRLQDDGGEAIARALLKNSSLCHLHLGANELTGRCAVMLAKVLLQNHTLRSLNLSCNSLGVVSNSRIIANISDVRFIMYHIYNCCPYNQNPLIFQLPIL